MNKILRNKQYVEYVEQKSPKAGWLSSLFHAFVMGGAICCLGQMFSDIIRSFFPMMDLVTAGAWVNIIIITITILLTAFGCFDRLGKYGGGCKLISFFCFVYSVSSQLI